MDKNQTKNDDENTIENNNNDEPNTKKIKWTKDHEKILIDWADKAMCYRWLHSKSHNKLSKINTYFTIPVIVMSTITGTANFAADRVPEQYRGYYSMVIGGVNIFAGIITTVQQFLKISELNEAHRVSSIAWDKFYRKIRVELAKPYDERQNVYDFLKSCTEEFDRLMETSPNISKEIIKLFNDTFNGEHVDKKKKELFENLKKPEICDSLVSVEESMYKEDESIKRENKYKLLIKDMIQSSNEMSVNEKNNLKFKIIDQFVENFVKDMMRGPNKQEMMNNLNFDELGISESDIVNYMDENAHKFVVKNNEDIIKDLGDIEMGDTSMTQTDMQQTVMQQIAQDTQLNRL